MANFSQNPFAFLVDEGDDSPAAIAPPKAPKAAANSPAAIPQATQRTVPGRAPRGNQAARGAPRNAGFRGDNSPRPQQGQDEGFSPAQKDDRGERTRGRGGSRGTRGVGRGRGRGGAGPRPDRHSQTGIHDSEKKEVQGWGGDDAKRELEAEDEGAADAAGEAKTGTATPAVDAAVTEDKAAEGEAKPNGAPAAPVEEDDNTISYEEYLAQKAAGLNVEGVESRSARKANVGQDESQWKDAVALLRKDEEEEQSYIAATKTKTQRQREQKAGKQLIEIDPHFPRPERRDGQAGRGGRGAARGGERGGRGRGEGRGAPRGAGGFRGGAQGRGPRSAELNPDDTNAFPALA